MKKIITLLVGLFFVIVARGQQPTEPPSIEERLKKLNEIILQDVQPTASQKGAIEKAWKLFLTTEDKARKENPPPAPGTRPDPKMKETIDKRAEERDEEVKKILSEVQFKKYKEAVKKLKPPPGPPGNNRPPQQ